MKRFAFFYFMKDEPEQIRELVSSHVDYWRALAQPDYSGGPFADRSGGLITFLTSDHAEAEQFVAGDPFVAGEVIAERWLKEWFVE